MSNELGTRNISDMGNFAISKDINVKKDMDIDLFRKVNIDNVPGGVESITALVREALAKELAGFENLKKLRITEDDELYVGTERFVKSKEIFTE